MVLRENKILLVSLPKGRIGEETSILYGSIFFARIWQAAQARRRDERQPFFLHIDEAQNYINMPLSLDTVLAEARKFALGLTLAAASNLTIAPSLYAKLPYDPAKDYVPISVLAHVSINFVVKVSYSSPPIRLSVRKK